MAADRTLSHSSTLRAFRGIKRICYAGLDSVALRSEVARRVTSVVPGEAYSFSTNDPDTGLLTHSVRDGVPVDVGRAYLERLYPREQAIRFIDLARSEEVVSRESSEFFRSVLRWGRIEHELHAALCVDGFLWGTACLLRAGGSRGFSDAELLFMRRIAPHLARGLKYSALLETARVREPTRQANGSAPAETNGAMPGVVALDRRGNVTLRNAAASTYLEDMKDVGVKEDELPSAFISVVLSVRARHARSGSGGSEPLDAQLQVGGRSGRWYTLRGSLAEADVSGDASTLVVIEPAGPREVAPILSRLYGLSAREREVLAHVARGESTKRIAALLGISGYTVQDHLDRASEKVGVRGRQALVARIFFDAYAPALAG